VHGSRRAQFASAVFLKAPLVIMRLQPFSPPSEKLRVPRKRTAAGTPI